MKTLGKIKLNQLSIAELEQRQMNALKGGCGCASCATCTCVISAFGAHPSSDDSSDNTNNAAQYHY